MTLTAIALPERFRPSGVAMLLGPSGISRVFLCDRRNHFVDVVDERARPLFSFGGRGRRPGQFIDPCDIVVVPPTDHSLFAIDQALVAVADRGNHRVQVFDASGTLVAVLAATESRRKSDRQAMPPLIRTRAFTKLSRLAWASPYLVVADSNRDVVRIDLSQELTPSACITSARSAIRVVLRRALADHPFGSRSPRREAQSPGGALRPPTAS
jgi:hypothetical protein